MHLVPHPKPNKKLCCAAQCPSSYSPECRHDERRRQAAAEEASASWLPPVSHGAAPHHLRPVPLTVTCNRMGGRSRTKKHKHETQSLYSHPQSSPSSSALVRALPRRPKQSPPACHPRRGRPFSTLAFTAPVRDPHHQIWEYIMTLITVSHCGLCGAIARITLGTANQ